MYSPSPRKPQPSGKELICSAASPSIIPSVFYIHLQMKIKEGGALPSLRLLSGINTRRGKAFIFYPMLCSTPLQHRTEESWPASQVAIWEAKMPEEEQKILSPGKSNISRLGFYHWWSHHVNSLIFQGSPSRLGGCVSTILTFEFKGFIKIITAIVN